MRVDEKWQARTCQFSRPFQIGMKLRGRIGGRTPYTFLQDQILVRPKLTKCSGGRVGLRNDFPKNKKSHNPQTPYKTYSLWLATPQISNDNESCVTVDYNFQ